MFLEDKLYLPKHLQNLEAFTHILGHLTIILFAKEINLKTFQPPIIPIFNTDQYAKPKTFDGESRDPNSKKTMIVNLFLFLKERKQWAANKFIISSTKNMEL